MSVVEFDADFISQRLDPRCAVIQLDSNAVFGQRFGKSLEHSRVTSAHVSEHFFLETGSPGRVHSRDSSPDECSRSLLVVLSQFGFEQRQPYPLERALARKSSEPFLYRDSFKPFPIFCLRGVEDRRSESKLAQKTQGRKPEKLHCVRHRIQLAAREESGTSLHPVHLVSEVQFLE